jgi:hypothetical protein
MRHPSVLFCVLVLVIGCSGAPDRPSAAAPPSGTFEGTTAGGESVVLSLEERGGALEGHGELAGRRVVLAGPVAWSATGFLTSEDGAAVPVRLQQLGRTVTLTTPDEVIVLDPGGVAPAAQPGPWTGRYEASEDGAVIAELRVTHMGSLLSGGGEILGDAVALTARISGEGRARGSLLYADGSQIAFAATRDAEGAIALSGLSAPLELVSR